LINEVNALKAKQPEGDWLSKVLELINALKAFVVDTINAAVSPLKTAIEQVQETIRASIAALERIIRDAIAALTGQLDREKSERQEADSSLSEKLAALESRMSENETKVEEVRTKLEDLGVKLGVVTGAIVLLNNRVDKIEAELIGIDGNVIQAIEAVKDRALSAIGNSEAASLAAIGITATTGTTAIVVAQSASIAAVGAVAAAGTAAIAAESAVVAGALTAATTAATTAIAAEAAVATTAITTEAAAATASMKLIELAVIAAVAGGVAALIAQAIAALEPKTIVQEKVVVQTKELVRVETVEKPYVVTETQIQLVDKPYVVTETQIQLVDKPVIVTQTETQVQTIEKPVVVTNTETREIVLYREAPQPVVVTNTNTETKEIVVFKEVEKPVIVTNTESKEIVVFREVEKPLVVRETRTEIREIEKPVVIRELPTCEELRLCLGERLIPRLPTCDEMQALDSCWPTENVSLPYAECEGGQGTVKSEQVKVLKGAVKPSVVDKFSKSANLGKDGCECVTELPGVSVPEWWEMRPEYERPQLCILFGLLDENTNKVGSAKYQVTIPHYNGEKPVKSPIPRYRKGSIYGILTLNDNSKVIVYAAAKEEAQKVIASAKRNIKAAQLGKATAKYGEMQGKERAPGVLVPREAHYYPKGLSKGAKPEWIQIFQKE
jgi:hypothetical protein